MYFENKVLKALIKAQRLMQKEKKDDDSDIEIIRKFLDSHIIDFIKWRVYPSSTVHSKMMTMKQLCEFNSRWLAKQIRKNKILDKEETE